MTDKKKKAKRESQRRRRRNNRKVETIDGYVLMIDGNYTKNPYAYCKSKKAWLTASLACTHKCEGKGCNSLEFRDVRDDEIYY